jgi:hypothetical protein
LKLSDVQIRKLFTNYQQEVYSLKNSNDNIVVNNNNEIKEGVLNNYENSELSNKSVLSDYRYLQLSHLQLFFSPLLPLLLMLIL